MACAATVGRVERHSAKPAVDIVAVGLGETVGHYDRSVSITLSADRIADAIERGHHLGHKPSDLAQHQVDGVGVDVRVPSDLQNLWQCDHIRKHQINVIQRWRIGIHWAIVPAGVVGQVIQSLI
jgi:hypothetical protein